LQVVLPRGAGTAAPASTAPLKQLMLEVSALGTALARRTALPTVWRRDFRWASATIPWRLRKELGLGATLPRRPRPGLREIGFLMPMFSFAGTEKVVQNQAAVFRARGWRTHLIIAGATELEIGTGTVEAFDSIIPFAGLGESMIDWRHGYLGIGLSVFGDSPNLPDALGVLAGLDVVLNTHAAGMHAAMAQLRRLGTRTYSGLHVMELSRWGQPMGNPHTVLPYEYAYDGFTVISEQLRDWCVAQGIPEAKLHLVRNAPAFAVPKARLDAAIAARRRRRGRLRVLSLGRLDQQKGVDRLAPIARLTAADLEWRIVGKPVLLDQAVPEFPVRLEPPAISAVELEELYAWADVVVLPSRYEGVPLTVLEAQRMGCAVIATEVGAVAEIVADGVDGLLVAHEGESEEAIIGAFVGHLRHLAANRGDVRALGEAAAARLARADWADNTAGFIDHLETVLPRDILA
jgi:glycosyltransferase involved in cell wall biosynthesis